MTWTSPLAELAGETREIVHPVLRDQDKDMYYRQWFDGYGVGSYQHEPRLVEAEEIRAHGAPDDEPASNPVRCRGLCGAMGGRLRADPGPAAELDRTGVQRHVLVHAGFVSRSSANRPRCAAAGWPKRSGSPTALASGTGDRRVMATGKAGSTCARPTSTGSSRTARPGPMSGRGARSNTARSTTSSTRCSRWNEPRPLRTSPFYARRTGAGRGLLRGARLGAAALVRGQPEAPRTLPACRSERVGRPSSGRRSPARSTWRRGTAWRCST